MTPDLDIAAGRVLYALRRAGQLHEREIPLFALGVTGEKLKDILERLRERGQARECEGVWSAV